MFGGFFRHVFCFVLLLQRPDLMIELLTIEQITDGAAGQCAENSGKRRRNSWFHKKLPVSSELSRFAAVDWHAAPDAFYHPSGWKVAKLCILQEKRAICDHKSHYAA
jgi:hypothetical protein